MIGRFKRLMGSLRSLLVVLAIGLSLMATFFAGLEVLHAKKTLNESLELSQRHARIVALIDADRRARTLAEKEIAWWSARSDASLGKEIESQNMVASGELDAAFALMADPKSGVSQLGADMGAIRAALGKAREAAVLASQASTGPAERRARVLEMWKAQSVLREKLDGLSELISRENKDSSEALAREWREEESISALRFVIAGLTGSVFVGGMTFWMYRRLGGRVDSLKRKAWRLQEGDLSSSLLPDEREDELSVVAETLEGMRIGLGSLLEELEDKVSKRTAELETSNGQLAKALDDLKQAQGEAVESKKRSALLRMSAVMSHEINTPISSAMLTISTMSDVAEKMRAMAGTGSLNRAALLALISKIESGVELAEESLGKASSTIEALKAATASDSSKSQDVIDLSSWASQYCEQKKHEWARSDLEVSFLCRYETLPVLTVEPMLRRTLDELMSNVSAHGFKGAKGRVLLSVGGGSSGAWIEVSDDGEGIDAENMSRIFDAYYTTEMGKHSGLGLFRAKTWAEDILKCTIECQSPCAPNGAENWRAQCKGPGSTFRIEGITLAKHTAE